VNNARGDVARFNSVLTEYARDPDTTRRRLYVEMIEDVFAPELARAGAEGGDSEAEMPEERSELIDRNLDNFLPLLNLQGGSAGTTTGGGTGGGTGGQP
jgi:membrane protease subunit HflK